MSQLRTNEALELADKIMITQNRTKGKTVRQEKGEIASRLTQAEKQISASIGRQVQNSTSGKTVPRR